jgi:hypothetical protein
MGLAGRVERSGTKDWHTLVFLQAFLAGERLAPSGPTEGASGVVRGAANLSGRADSKGK